MLRTCRFIGQMHDNVVSYGAWAPCPLSSSLDAPLVPLIYDRKSFLTAAVICQAANAMIYFIYNSRQIGLNDIINYLGLA